MALLTDYFEEGVPIGGVIGNAGPPTPLPFGYLDASQSLLASQATYADLFAVVGQRFSPGITATLLSNIATNAAYTMSWHDTGTKLLLAVANQFNGVTNNLNSVIYEVNPVTGVATLLSNIATNSARSMTWHDTGTKLLLAVANQFNDVTYNLNSVIYEINPVTGVATLLSNIATNGARSMTWHDTGTKLLLAVSNSFNGVTYNLNSVIYEINPVTGVATLLSNIATHGAIRMSWHDTGTKLLLAVANWYNGVTYNINSVIYEVNPVTGVATLLSNIATNAAYTMSWHDTGTKLLLAVANWYNGVTHNINSVIYEINPVTGVATLLSNIATHGAFSMTWHDTGTKLLLAVANSFNGVTYNLNSVIYEVNPVTGVATLLSNIATNSARSMTWHDTGTKLLLAVANQFNDVTYNLNSVIYEIGATSAPVGQFYLPDDTQAGINNAIIKYIK